MELSDMVSPIQRIEGDTQLFCRFQQDPVIHDYLKHLIESIDALYTDVQNPEVKYSYDYASRTRLQAPIMITDESVRFCTFEIYAHDDADMMEVHLVPTMDFNGITFDFTKDPVYFNQLNDLGVFKTLATKILVDNARSEDGSMYNRGRSFFVSVDIYRNRGLSSAGIYHRDIVSADVGPAEHLSLEYFLANPNTVALSPEIVRDTTSGNIVSEDELRVLAMANPIDRVLITDKTVVCASNREVTHASPSVHSSFEPSRIAQQSGRFRSEFATPEMLIERFGNQGLDIIRASYEQRSFIRLLRHSHEFSGRSTGFVVMNMPMDHFTGIDSIEFTELDERHHAGGGKDSILQTIKLYTAYKIGVKISDIKEVKLSRSEIIKKDNQFMNNLTIKKGGKTKRKTKGKTKRKTKGKTKRKSRNKK